MDAVRAAESQAASLVLQAGRTAEERIAAARREAEHCKEAARSAGLQAGQAAKDRQIQQAQADAAEMVAAAQKKARAVQKEGLAHLDEAAAWALAVVLGEVRPGQLHIPAAPESDSLTAQVANASAQRKAL